MASINFPKELSPYLDAAANIGFGGVIKLILECTQAFWPEEMGFVVSNERIPTWWTQFPAERLLLTGWVGGTKANMYEYATDEEIKNDASQSLSSIFGLPVSKLENSIDHFHIYNWFKDPYTRGDYSYAYPQSETARELLRKGFQDKIWFAGEGLYSGEHPGTVEAALETVEELLMRFSSL